MPLGAITSPWWIALAAILVILLVVLLRLTLQLLERVKDLAASAGQTSEQLKAALGDVQAEGKRASERLENLGGRRRRP